MTRRSNPFAVAACALAASLLVAACGGGTATSPDVVPPTVAISSSVAAGATATGVVTFTFTFSEDVASTFTAEDITVTGGTAGALAKVDSLHYTLAVTPTAGGPGTLTVSVAAAKFSDLSLNANTAAATVSQAFDTTPPPTVTGTSLVSFDETTALVFVGFNGAEGSTVEAGPVGGSGKAIKIVRAGGEVYAGAFVVTPVAIPLADNRRTITARVYSPKAGIPMVLKVEVNTVGGAASADAAATTAVVVGWQTLTWNLTGLDLSKSYSKITMLPNLGTVAPLSGETYYFDDIRLADAAAVVAPAPTGVLASFDETTALAFLGFNGAEGTTVENGPAGGNGKALKILRLGGDVFAGAIVTTGAIPFAADRKTITARVYSPTAGIPMVMKVEDANASASGESAATPAVVVGWQTLTWVIGGLDAAKTYSRIVLLPKLGTVDPAPGQAYYFDDITLAPAAAVAAPPAANIVMASFDETTAVGFVGFNGGEGSTVEAGPAGGSGKALKILRSGGEVYAGAFITPASPVAFAADRKTITARVYSPTAGVRMVLKVEGSSGLQSADIDATPAVVAGWQTLSWTVTGIDITKSYTKITILPNLGTVDAAPGKAYYVDDITLLAAAATPSSVPVTIATLDEASAAVRGFEGAYDATIVTEAAVKNENAACGSTSTNKVGRSVKPASNVANYAGLTVITVANGGLPKIAFTDAAKTMTLRVWSPAAGLPVRLKVEDNNDGSKSVETEATTTAANAWQTLTFNFASPASDAPKALNLATTYDKATVFFNFGKTGAQAGGAQTFYFDDLTFVTGTGTNTVLASFDESTPRVLTGFGGAEDSTLVGTSALPAGSTSKAVKVLRSASALSYAGTSVVAKLNDAVPTIPFTASATKMSLRVCSSYPIGLRVRMKVEKAGSPEINSEVDAYTTVTNAWETLTFDFGPNGKHFIPNGPGPNGYNLTLPTAQLEPSTTRIFNKVNIFFDYGLGDGGYAAMPDQRTYYFDDLKFIGQ